MFICLKRIRLFFFFCAILETLLVLVHIRFVEIHPIGYIIWPLSLLLFWQLVTYTRKEKSRFAVIVLTSITYFFVSYSLVLDKEEGLVFDTEPFLNLTFITNAVLLIALLLFLLNLHRRKSFFESASEFISFSSIPWVFPLTVEITYLVRWWLEGVFFQKTAEKAIGGAGLGDVLFQYGFRNFILSCIIILNVGVLRKLIIWWKGN